jgi:hypothetical protein
MNSEFWNIFQWNSSGFSDRIPIGIVPSPVGKVQGKRQNKIQSKGKRFVVVTKTYYFKQNNRNFKQNLAKIDYICQNQFKFI